MAEERARYHLKEMLVPFEIPKVKETKIVSVLHHIGGLRAQILTEGVLRVGNSIRVL